MQKNSTNTEQTILDNITDKYVLSEMVFGGVDGSNMLSRCYNLLYVWAAAKMGRMVSLPVTAQRLKFQQ